MSRTTRTKKAAAPTTSEGNTLRVEAKQEESREQLIARLAVNGTASNAWTLTTFSAGTFGEVSLSECIDAMRDRAKAVNSGNLAGVESLLMSQALALNAMFGELARRAHLNMGEHMSATESYMKLALKAQAQCRSTLEALAEIKAPRSVAFVAQANVANGPQQVNNGTPAPAARTEKPATPQNELLEDQHGHTLDTGAQGSASRPHQELAPVGAIDRPKDR